jgi:hypothetical protein
METNTLLEIGVVIDRVISSKVRPGSMALAWRQISSRCNATTSAHWWSSWRDKKLQVRPGNIAVAGRGETKEANGSWFTAGIGQKPLEDKMKLVGYGHYKHSPVSTLKFQYILPLSPCHMLVCFRSV